jgi:hypothetical protein
MQVGMALTPNSLARRKPGVQIPSPPPPTLQVRASPASSRRRSLHAAAALRPQAQVTVQPKGSQRPADPGPGLSDDHAAWSPPAASRRVILASSLSRSAWPTANHLPRRPSPSRPSAGLVRPSASFEGQASTSGRRRAVMDTAGDHAGHPSRAAAGPTATPRDLIPSDTADAGTHGHREPDTGHLTLRRPHRTPVTGQAPVGQRTLAPDTDGDFGSSVEPTAKLHPLCTVALREVASVVAASSLGRSGDWRRSLDDLFVADVRTRRILASAPRRRYGRRSLGRAPSCPQHLQQRAASTLPGRR